MSQKCPMIEELTTRFEALLEQTNVRYATLEKRVNAVSLEAARETTGLSEQVDKLRADTRETLLDVRREANKEMDDLGERVQTLMDSGKLRWERVEKHGAWMVAHQERHDREGRELPDTLRHAAPTIDAAIAAEKGTTEDTDTTEDIDAREEKRLYHLRDSARKVGERIGDAVGQAVLDSQPTTDGTDGTDDTVRIEKSVQIGRTAAWKAAWKADEKTADGTDDTEEEKEVKERCPENFDLLALSNEGLCGWSMTRRENVYLLYDDGGSLRQKVSGYFAVKLLAVAWEQLDLFKGEVATLSGRLDELQAARDALKQWGDELQAQYTVHRAALAEHRAERDELQAMVTAQRSELADYGATVSRLRQELANIKAEKTTDDTDRLVAERDELQTALGWAREKVGCLMEERDQLKGELATVVRQRDKLTIELSERNP